MSKSLHSLRQKQSDLPRFRCEGARQRGLAALGRAVHGAGLHQPAARHLVGAEPVLDLEHARHVGVRGHDVAVHELHERVLQGGNSIESGLFRATFQAAFGITF